MKKFTNNDGTRGTVLVYYISFNALRIYKFLHIPEYIMKTN